MKFKKYILSRFIYLLPFEESFFFTTKFEKKIKLADELIALNYKKYSPYKKPLFSTLMEEKNLYIWFYEKSIDSKLIIPESYLLFNYLKEKDTNKLFLIELNHSYVVLIIKNNSLVKSYTIFDEDESIVAMEMNRYSLSSFEKIDKEEYVRIKEEALVNLGFNDLYKWMNINIDSTNMVPSLVNSIAYPLSFLLLFIMSVEIYHLNGVEKRLAFIEESYSKAKEKNDDIREKINSENRKEKKWVDFVHRELPYIDSLTMFLRISKSFINSNITFRSFSIVGSRVKIDIETKADFIIGLNILNKVEGLKNVTLKYSNKKRHTASYEATILSKGLTL